MGKKVKIHKINTHPRGLSSELLWLESLDSVSDSFSSASPLYSNRSSSSVVMSNSRLSNNSDDKIKGHPNYLHGRTYLFYFNADMGLWFVRKKLIFIAKDIPCTPCTSEPDIVEVNKLVTNISNSIWFSEKGPLWHKKWGPIAWFSIKVRHLNLLWIFIRDITWTLPVVLPVRELCTDGRLYVVVKID